MKPFQVRFTLSILGVCLASWRYGSRGAWHYPVASDPLPEALVDHFHLVYSGARYVVKTAKNLNDFIQTIDECSNCVRQRRYWRDSRVNTMVKVAVNLDA